MRGVLSSLNPFKHSLPTKRARIDVDALPEWSKGRDGKGLLLDDGELITWATTSGAMKYPFHQDVELALDEPGVAAYLMIGPDGKTELQGASDPAAAWKAIHEQNPHLKLQGTADYWAFEAATPEFPYHNWKRGNDGKGIIVDGDIHTWNTNWNGAPHHFQYLADLMGDPEDYQEKKYNEGIDKWYDKSMGLQPFHIQDNGQIYPGGGSDEVDESIYELPGIEDNPAVGWKFGKRQIGEWVDPLTDDTEPIYSWELGLDGKGAIDPSGKVHLWSVDYAGEPHHDDYFKGLDYHSFFYVMPDGEVNSYPDDRHPEAAEKILASHPDLKRGDETEGWKFSSSVPYVVHVDTGPLMEFHGAGHPFTYDPKKNTVYYGDLGRYHHEIEQGHPDYPYVDDLPKGRVDNNNIMFYEYSVSTPWQDEWKTAVTNALKDETFEDDDTDEDSNMPWSIFDRDPVNMQKDWKFTHTSSLESLKAPVEWHSVKDDASSDDHGDSHPLIWDGKTVHVGPLGTYHFNVDWPGEIHHLDPAMTTGRYYPNSKLGTVWYGTVPPEAELGDGGPWKFSANDPDNIKINELEGIGGSGPDGLFAHRRVFAYDPDTATIHLSQPGAFHMGLKNHLADLNQYYDKPMDHLVFGSVNHPRGNPNNDRYETAYGNPGEITLLGDSGYAGAKSDHEFSYRPAFEALKNHLGADQYYYAENLPGAEDWHFANTGPVVQWHGDQHHMQGDHSFIYRPEENTIHIGSPELHHYDLHEALGTDEWDEDSNIIGSVFDDHVNMDTRVDPKVKGAITNALGLPGNDWKFEGKMTQKSDTTGLEPATPKLSFARPSREIPNFKLTSSRPSQTVQSSDIHPDDNWQWPMAEPNVTVHEPKGGISEVNGRVPYWWYYHPFDWNDRHVYLGTPNSYHDDIMTDHNPYAPGEHWEPMHADAAKMDDYAVGGSGAYDPVKGQAYDLGDGRGWAAYDRDEVDPYEHLPEGMPYPTDRPEDATRQVMKHVENYFGNNTTDDDEWKFATSVLL